MFKIFKGWAVLSGSDSFNTCITQIGYDGAEWYGFSQDYVSTIDPTHTADGTPIYAFECNASGDFRVRFGDTGDIKLVGFDQFLVNEDLAVWSDTTKQYEFSNVDWATEIINEHTEPLCFNMSGLPTDTPFIWYTFEEIETYG